jgi:hypothetical protein
MWLAARLRRTCPATTGAPTLLRMMGASFFVVMTGSVLSRTTWRGSSLFRFSRRPQKKNDAAGCLQAFHHVGLLVNGPPGITGLPSSSHPTNANQFFNGA